MNSLKSMLELLGDLTGKSPNVEGDKQQMIRWLNSTAEILWQKDDLPNSLRSVFIDEPTTRIVSFPEYVGQLRGVRRCRVKREVLMQSARYQSHIPHDCYTPTVLHRSAVSDTSVDFTNLRVVFSEALTCPVTVTITGNTTSSSAHRVTLTFGVGETVKSVVAAFVGITSIHKSAVTNADMKLLSDVNDVLSIIPSNALTSSYLLYQVFDADCSCDVVTPGTYAAFELFYKPVLLRLSNDNDSFQADGMENALAYYTAFLQKQKSTDEGAQRVAKGFYGVAMEIMRGAATDDAVGKIAPVGIMRNSGFVRVGGCYGA